MIDSSLAPHLFFAVVLFHLKQFGWMYLWPVLVGFVAISVYQIYARVAAGGRAHPTVIFALSAIAAMLSLFGWVTMMRTLQMIPLYGCGVGLANLMMSRVYAATMVKHRWLRIRLPRVIWRGDREGVARFQEQFRAKLQKPV